MTGITFFNGVLSITETKNLFLINGILMIICSNFVVFFFIIKKIPIYFKEVWEKSEDLLLIDHGFVINSLIYMFVLG